MTTLDTVTTIARNYLRDFPQFFQTTFDAAGRTYQLGHPNIEATSLYVATYNPSGGSASVTTDYTLDDRNGIIRFGFTPNANYQVMIEGYYYEWILPSDLEFYAQVALDKHIVTLDVPVASLSSGVIDIIGMAAIIEALWALLMEYSRDIDVITSESVHIPASQRFRMIMALLDQWEAKYKAAAAALNIGLERMEVLTLRRQSRTTYRLVPVYKNREIEDVGPSERLWPPIDDGLVEITEPSDEMRQDAFIDEEPPTIATLPVPNW